MKRLFPSLSNIVFHPQRLNRNSLSIRRQCVAAFLAQSPLSGSQRHLSAAQVTNLDHAIRQIIATSGPVPLPKVLQKLPDEIREGLSELNGGLLEYLQSRRQLYLLRRLPDGKNIVSFSPEAALSFVGRNARGNVKKAATAIFEFLNSHSFAHLVDGVHISEVEKNINAGTRITATNHSADLLTFIASFPEVFEVSMEARKVKLVCERTPLPGKCVAAYSSTTTPQQSGSKGTPRKVDTTARAGDSSRQRVEVLIVTLCRFVPAAYYVSLSTMMSCDAARNAIVDLCQILRPLNVTEDSFESLGKRFISILEDQAFSKIVSRVVDCRLFCDDETFDLKMCFLRRSCSPAAAAAAVPSTTSLTLTAEGDHLFASNRPSQHTDFLLHIVCKWLVQRRGSLEACHQWLAELIAGLQPLTSSPQRMDGRVDLSTTDLSNIVSFVERVKPPFVALADVQDAIDAAANGESAAEADDDNQRVAAAAFRQDGLVTILTALAASHIFETNMDTYEIAVRPEIFAAWLLVTQENAAASANLSTVFFDTLSTAHIVHPEISMYTRHVFNTSKSTGAPTSIAILEHIWSSWLSNCEHPHLLDLRQNAVAQQEALAWLRRDDICVEVYDRFHRHVSDKVLLLAALHAPSEFLLCDKNGTTLSADAIRKLWQAALLPEQTNSTPNEVLQIFVWTPSMVLRARKNMIAKLHNIEISGANYSSSSSSGISSGTNLDANAAISYGGRMWSRGAVATAIFDSLPEISDDASGPSCDVVSWHHHLSKLQREYSDVIPPAVLETYCLRNALNFFQSFPELFAVFELAVLRSGTFAIGRAGARAPIGCHPRRCETVEDAIKQLARMCVGGIGEEQAMSSLSTEARSIIRKHGGAIHVALQLPQFFEVRPGIISYTGAGKHDGSRAQLVLETDDPESDDCL